MNKRTLTALMIFSAVVLLCPQAAARGVQPTTPVSYVTSFRTSGLDEQSCAERAAAIVEQELTRYRANDPSIRFTAEDIRFYQRALTNICNADRAKFFRETAPAISTTEGN